MDTPTDSGLPFGYRRGRGGSVLPDPTEQEVLGVLRVLRSEGLSLAGTARRLSELGFRNRRGNPFSRGGVAHLERSLRRHRADRPPHGGA